MVNPLIDKWLACFTKRKILFCRRDIYSFWKWKWKITQLCLTLCDPWNSPDQNTGEVSLSLLQGIFPTQGSNPCLPHFRWTLYQLSHKGSPRILEWVAYPFSSGFSQPRNWTRVFSIASRSFTNWAIREDSNLSIYLFNWIVHSIDISWVPTVYQNLPDFVSGNSKINKTCPRRVYSLVKEIDMHTNICNAIW